jgi:hypothetical protein
MPGALGESGYALLLMLAVLALGSILVAASFLMARLEAQSGEGTLNGTRAYEAAESGLAEITAWWDPQLYDTLPVGDSLAVPRRMLGTGSYVGSVRRVSEPLFLVRVEGEVPNPPSAFPARRLLTSLVRLEGTNPGIHAALTVRDSFAWDASGTINGTDTVPPGWISKCSGIDSSVAGVRYAPSVVPSWGSCGGSSCATGTPGATVDSTVADSTLLSFGGQGYSSLALRALRTPTGTIGPIGPAVIGSPSSCLLSDSLNWGEPTPAGPTAACQNYYPIVHAPGDLTLTGGRGQGVLLVDGNLTLSGGTAFTGLVVVQGTLTSGAGGGSIVGAAIARRVLVSSVFSGPSLQLQYSACVLPYTVRGSAVVTPLPYRSWSQAY